MSSGGLHTSGKFGVTPKKELELLAEMQRLGIREQDIEEAFMRGSGAGGQHRNKTSTRVRLLHRPTGIAVSYQRERSRALNRFFARRLLCEKMQEHLRNTPKSGASPVS
jgi:peptide chain release factor